MFSIDLVSVERMILHYQGGANHCSWAAWFTIRRTTDTRSAGAFSLSQSQTLSQGRGKTSIASEAVIDHFRREVRYEVPDRSRWLRTRKSGCRCWSLPSRSRRSRQRSRRSRAGRGRRLRSRRSRSKPPCVLDQSSGGCRGRIGCWIGSCCSSDCGWASTACPTIASSRNSCWTTDSTCTPCPTGPRNNHGWTTGSKSNSCWTWIGRLTRPPDRPPRPASATLVRLTSNSPTAKPAIKFFIILSLLHQAAVVVCQPQASCLRHLSWISCLLTILLAASRSL